MNIHKKHIKKLMKRQNVVGLATGTKIKNGKDTGEKCITVFVEKKKPISELKIKDIIPETIETKTEGLPTDIIELGKLKALDTPEELEIRKKKLRPCPMGVSISHYLVSAGTAGTIIEKNGSKYILSNAHILANSGDAEIGDKCYQPGIYDGTDNPDNVIGTLSEYVPISFETWKSWVCLILHKLCKLIGCKNVEEITISSKELKKLTGFDNNVVDVALAKPISEDMVSNNILGIGEPTGYADAKILDKITKSGRTTGVTNGTVFYTDGIVRIEYGGGRHAVFEDQIISNMKILGGDSGSIALNIDKKIIGICFAGGEGSIISGVKVNISVINKISNVRNLLNF